MHSSIRKAITTKKEIVKVLKQSEINGFIRGIVSSKLIDGYDKEDDGFIDWEEFKFAIDAVSDESK